MCYFCTLSYTFAVTPSHPMLKNALAPNSLDPLRVGKRESDCFVDETTSHSESSVAKNWFIADKAAAKKAKTVMLLVGFGVCLSQSLRAPTFLQLPDSSRVASLDR